VEGGAWDDAFVMPENRGSQRFQRALQSTGAELLADPLKHGSFYCHAEIARAEGPATAEYDRITVMA
jgi:hypothetical protein